PPAPRICSGRTHRTTRMGGYIGGITSPRVLVVRGSDGDPREMVFDPLLFDRPVPVEEWQSALHDTPTLVRTILGEPPLPTCGGTGYWPGPDPLEGPDVHASETLDEYRQGSA